MKQDNSTAGAVGSWFPTVEFRVSLIGSVTVRLCDLRWHEGDVRTYNVRRRLTK